MNDILMALSLQGTYTYDVVIGVLDFSARNLPLRWEYVWLHFTVCVLSFDKNIMAAEHFG
jgi:hypothetical protein